MSGWGDRFDPPCKKTDPHPRHTWGTGTCPGIADPNAKPATDAVRVAVARLVADHWRVTALKSEGEFRLTAHPLCMVLAALNGEIDPVELGIEPGPDAEAIRRCAA